MFQKITPAIKGLITGFVLIATGLLIEYTKQHENKVIQYLPPLLYASGIAWTLLAYKRSPDFTGKFGDSFGQGFRCFIVVTLIMVGFTFIYIKMHPELPDLEAKATREYLMKEKQNLPAEIEEKALQAKKQYTTSRVSLSVFGYLIMGSVFTAIGSVLLTRRKF